MLMWLSIYKVLLKASILTAIDDRWFVLFASTWTLPVTYTVFEFFELAVETVINFYWDLILIVSQFQSVNFLVNHSQDLFFV